MSRHTILLVLALAACRNELPKPVLPLTPTPDSRLRTPPPLVATSRRIVAPHVEVSRLSNGLTIAAVDSRHDARAAFYLLNTAAGGCGPQEEEGMAFLTAAMMLRGTRLPDGRVLRDVRVHGNTVSVRVDSTYTSASLSVPVSHVDSAMTAFASVIRNPVFDDAEFSHAASETADKAVWNSHSVVKHLLEATTDALRGDGHCVSRSQVGHLKSIEKISPADVRGFYSRRWGPAHSALVIVSDLPADRALALAEASFGDWHNPAQVAPPAVPPYRTGSARKRVIVINGYELLATWMVGFAVPAANHPDNFALILAAEILSGSVTSRVAMSLRHNSGRTYGVLTDLDQRADAGELVLYSSCEHADVGPSIRDVLSDAERLATSQPTDEELVAAKTALLAHVAVALSEATSVATGVGALFGSFPLDYLDGLEARVEAISAKDVSAAAARWLAPASAQLAAYGDFSSQADEYEIRSLGEVDWQRLDEGD